MDATASYSVFTRELVDRLSSEGAAELAAKTGLHESIVREMSAGKSQDLFSWEIVSACATAAGHPREAIVQLRELWVKAESAQWAVRGPKLLRGIELQARQARRQRPYDDKALSRLLFGEYRPSVPWRKTPASGNPHGPWRLESWSSTQLISDQRIPDPNRAMSLSEFYELLRQLYLWAGRPSYNEIEQRSWGVLSRTTAGNVLGAARPLQRQVRDHDNVRYLATVFGLPPTEVERWTKAYNRVRELPPKPATTFGRRDATRDRPHGTGKLSLDPLSSAEPRTGQSPKSHDLLSLKPSQPVPDVKIIARLRRWRITALCFAMSTAVLGTAIAVMAAAGDPPEAQNLQFPTKHRLSPGRPAHIPLQLPAGNWSLTLHFRLESTEVASACVNDAQLSYVVEKTNGIDIAAGRITKGKSDSWVPAIRLNRSDILGTPQVTVSVSVPSYDIGCAFTIDLSGSIIRP